MPALVCLMQATGRYANFVQKITLCSSITPLTLHRHPVLNKKDSRAQLESFKLGSNILAKNLKYLGRTPQTFPVT